MCLKSIYLENDGKKWNAYDDLHCMLRHRCQTSHSPYFFD